LAIDYAHEIKIEELIKLGEILKATPRAKAQQGTRTDLYSEI